MLSDGCLTKRVLQEEGQDTEAHRHPGGQQVPHGQLPADCDIVTPSASTIHSSRAAKQLSRLLGRRADGCSGLLQKQ